MAVYFVKTGAYVKIGYAKNVNQRVSDIQTANPYDVELLGSIDTKNPKRVESDMHKRFAEDHYRGEWYHASVPLLSYIAVHASEPRNIVERGKPITPIIHDWVLAMRTRIDDMRAAIPATDKPMQLYLF